GLQRVRAGMWQEDVEARAFAGCALNLNAATVLADGAIDGRETQPRTLAEFLGGIEGLEDVLDYLFGDTDSAVANAQLHVVAGLVQVATASLARAQGKVACLEAEPPAM